jgi:ribonuclease-3
MIEDRLGYRVRDAKWLDRALTHDSYAHERRAGPGADYEGLEFAGDALLGFVVSDFLFRADPSSDEGALTRRRQTIVNRHALADAARKIGLGEAVRLGRGEQSSGGQHRSSILAAAFESVLAAIYFDGGLRPARAFVRRHLGELLASSATEATDRTDSKTRLQESIQARHGVTPRYRLAAVDGPAHARRFIAEVLIDGEVAGSGVGSSRKTAEQAAARAALDALGAS